MIVVVDVSQLCHAALHTMGGLSHGPLGTGVLFGFMKQMETIHKSMLERFPRENGFTYAFTFDGPRNELRRRDLLPEYKANRDGPKDEDVEEVLADLHIQSSRVRTQLLPAIGFRSLYKCKGYEADDLMAELVASNTQECFTIVSSDKDMLQMLRHTRVRCLYSPRNRRFTTLAMFKREFGIGAGAFAKAKAIAGDDGDNVPGVRGVGLATAIKFINGDLKVGGAKDVAIRAFLRSDEYIRNLRLVELPFDGTPMCFLELDHFDKRGWEDVCEKFGLHKVDRVLWESMANGMPPPSAWQQHKQRTRK